MVVVASRVACVPGGTAGILGAKSTVSWSPLVFSVVWVSTGGRCRGSCLTLGETVSQRVPESIPCAQLPILAL